MFSLVEFLPPSVQVHSLSHLPQEEMQSTHHSIEVVGLLGLLMYFSIQIVVAVSFLLFNKLRVFLRLIGVIACTLILQEYEGEGVNDSSFSPNRIA